MSRLLNGSYSLEESTTPLQRINLYENDLNDDDDHKNKREEKNTKWLQQSTQQQHSLSMTNQPIDMP